MSNQCMYVAACVYKLLKTFPRATLFQNYCNLNLVSFNEIKKKKKWLKFMRFVWRNKVFNYIHT